MTSSQAGSAMDVDEEDIQDIPQTSGPMPSDSKPIEPVNPTPIPITGTQPISNSNRTTIDLTTDPDPPHLVPPSTSGVPPKRRKKRTRDEMEVECKVTITSNDTITPQMTAAVDDPSILSMTSSLSSTANSTNTKRRKLSTIKPKTPNKATIQPMAPKWKAKYDEYAHRILEHFKLLQNERTDASQRLMECPDTRRQIELFQHRLAAVIDAESTNNNNSSNGEEQKQTTDSAINLKAVLEGNMALISRLVHDRTEGLTDLAVHVRTLLVGDHGDAWSAVLSTFTVREWILKAAQRKLYGIKPGPKINKTEECMTAMTTTPTVAMQWKKCRLYVWECFDGTVIGGEFEVDRKEMRTQSANISKYGAFCKKYDILAARYSMKQSEKGEQLQKIDDGIMSWKSKQEAAERIRLQREEQLRIKKENRERQLKEKQERKEQLERERREKKEEMERIRKEKALQKQREKEEKQKEKEAQKEQKEKLAKERAEKKQQKLALKKSKTPQSHSVKKRKSSFLDKWVKVTKFEDTSNRNTTPIIRHKTVSLNTPIAAMEKMSVSKQSGLGLASAAGTESSCKSLYEELFAPFHCGKGSTLPSNYPHPPVGYHSVIEIVDHRLVVDSKRKRTVVPKPTAIPMVVVDVVNDRDLIDLTKGTSTEIHSMVSRMQIDDASDNGIDGDIVVSSNSNSSKRLKLQWKYRSFDADNRPPFFGVNQCDRSESMHRISRQELVGVARSGGQRRLSVDRKVVSYDSDDSGVEWYGDIDDLENVDDLEEIDDDEAELAKAGLIRSDGFEDDQFIIDSDDEMAIGDKDAMRNMEKFKALRNRLKGEYPVRPQRIRGDSVDRPIMVRLPSMKQWSTHSVLQPLTVKKAVMEMDDGVAVEHKEGDNALDRLLEIENKEEEQEREREKEEKRERKRRKKEKRRKRKMEKMEKLKKDGDAINGGDDGSGDGMECDDGTQDEDDDIKMDDAQTVKDGVEGKATGNGKGTKQNTLNQYFKPSPKGKPQGLKRKMDDVDTKRNEADAVLPKPAKKKRRLVMCELVE